MSYNETQKTIAKKISFKGIGLHTGKICKVNLLPAPENSGIIFKRIDLPDNNNLVKPDEYINNDACSSPVNNLKQTVFFSSINLKVVLGKLVT